jgi:hypothetical protein
VNDRLEMVGVIIIRVGSCNSSYLYLGLGNQWELGCVKKKNWEVS